MKIKIFIVIAFSLILVTCKDEYPDIPIGSGNQINIEQTEDSISYWNAFYNGNISNLNKRNISQYGHCWDTIANPDLTKGKTIFNNINTDIEFSSTLEGLQPNVNYYIRSYFILGTDTAYSTENNFKTLSIQKPKVKKNTEPETELYSAVLQGKITDTGGEILCKGFYFDVNPNVSDADSIVINTSDTLIFNDTLKNLLPNTTYYAKAFASNRAGKGLSNEFSFKTQTQLVEISTTKPTDILAYSCHTGGNITNDFGSQVTQRGVCYSKNPNPTVNDSITTDGEGSGIWVSELTKLQANTNYFLRAYAINEKGIAYGNELSFKTEIGLPVIETYEVTNIMAESAISGGKITDTGGDEITEKGVCWNITGSPTIDDFKTKNGSDSEPFESTITNLDTNTTYYVKAYAQNSRGVAYGNEVFFSTQNGVPKIIIYDVINIELTSAISKVNIISDGGIVINLRGVCWNLEPNPTISDFKTEQGCGIGEFSNQLTNLDTGTMYYLRPYVINSNSITYGDEISFYTKGVFKDNRDNHTYKWIMIGNQTWMAENLAWLPDVSPPSFNSETDPIYYVYDYEGNDISTAKSTYNYSEYGVLYNWPAAVNSCPTGYHLPSKDEYLILIEYLGGTKIAGAKLKEIGTYHWSEPNTGATNSSSFTALPGGGRGSFSGSFATINYSGYLWSSTDDDTSYPWFIFLSYDEESVSIGNGYTKSCGHSVRCLKD